MAVNIHASGTTDGTIEFDRPVGYLNVFVGSGVTFSLSLDLGENYITLPAGFHNFPIGPVSEVQVQANGAWQLVATQA